MIQPCPFNPNIHPEAHEYMCAKTIKNGNYLGGSSYWQHGMFIVIFGNRLIVKEWFKEEDQLGEYRDTFTVTGIQNFSFEDWKHLLHAVGLIRIQPVIVPLYSPLKSETV